MIDPATLAGSIGWFRAKDLGTGSVTSWSNVVGVAATLTNATVATASTPSGGKSVAMASSSAPLNADLFAPCAVIPYASSRYNASSLASRNLYDGNTGTEWCAATAPSVGTPIIIRYQIRAGATVVTSYTITPTSGALVQPPRDWTFQGSNDGTTWTTLDTQTGQTYANANPVTYNFSNSTAYSFYQLRATAMTGGVEMRMSGLTLGGITAGSTVYGGEMWMVIKSGGTGASAFSFGSSGQQSHYTWDGTNVYSDFGATGRYSFAATLATTSWRLLRFSITSGGTWNAYLDNVNQSTVAATVGWRTDPVLSNTWTGNIAEVLLRSQVSTSPEVADLITYFNTEHGLSVAGGTPASNEGWGVPI